MLAIKSRGAVLMRIAILSPAKLGRVFRDTASLLILALLLQPVFGFATPLTESKKAAAMTADQRIAHVLSRLTFGARPGDFEKVKAMGVDAFINQQLDPDSIDQSG